MQAHTQGFRVSSESRVTRVCCPLSIRDYSQSKMPRAEMDEKYDFFGLSFADVFLLGPFGQVKPRTGNTREPRTENTPITQVSLSSRENIGCSCKERADGVQTLKSSIYLVEIFVRFS